MIDYAADLLGEKPEKKKAPAIDYAADLLGEEQKAPEQQAIPRDQIAGSVFNRTLDAPGMNPLQKTIGSAKVGLGFFLNNNEKARADIIKKQFPKAQFARDEEGRILVRGSENEPYAYINAPGIGAQEAADFSGDVVKFAPVSRAVQGLSLLGRVGVGVAGAFATSAASDAASGAIGSEQGIDYGKAAFAGAGQGAGELIATGLGSLGRALSRGKARADPAALVETIETEAAQGARRSIAGAQAADDLAKSFDVPLTKGQATGSLEQQAFESRALRGGLGDNAQQTLDRFSRDQTRRVKDAGSALAGERITANPNEAGAIVKEGLRSRASSLQSSIDDAYTLARSHNAKLDARAIPNLVDNVTQAAPEEFRFLLDANPRDAARSYPQATTAFRSTRSLVNDIAKRSNSSTRQRVTALDFARIEAHRKLLNGLIDGAEAPADRRAVIQMKAALDGWLDGAVSNKLFEGDEAFLEAFKRARGLRAQYARQFGADGAKDFAGKAIDDIIKNDPTPEETLNMLFGASNIGAKRGVAETVKQIKTITGGGEEFQALREAALDRIMKRGFGRGGEQFRVGTLIEQFDNALNGSGKSVMQELYTPQELGRMRQYVTVLKQLEPKPGAVNTSNSAIEAMRAGRRLLGTFGKGHEVIFDRLLKGVADPNAMRARQAIQGAPRRLPSLPAPTSAVGAAAPALDDERR